MRTKKPSHANVEGGAEKSNFGAKNETKCEIDIKVYLKRDMFKNDVTEIFKFYSNFILKNLRTK